MNRTRMTCLTVAAALAASSFVSTRQTPAPQNPPPTPAAAAAQAPGGRGSAPVKSPEVGADQRVTFRLRAPNTKEVLVSVGGKRLPMQKDDQGLWSVTSDPMAPDIYTYSLIVDGASISDPGE